jgi:hypothetical protein
MPGIAATALLYDAPLIPHNPEDYSGVSSLPSLAAVEAAHQSNEHGSAS